MPHSAHTLAILVATGVMAAFPVEARLPPYPKIPADAPSPHTARVADREPKGVDLGAGSQVASHVTVSGGKGSVAVGLAFGVLGVAANVAKAKSQNEARAKPLGQLIQFDVLGTFKSIRSAATVSDDTAPVYELMPIVNFDFDDQTTFRINCQVAAILARKGKKPMRTIYQVRMADIYDSGKADEVAVAKDTVTPCLTEANRLFEVHARGGLLPTETVHDVVINGKTIPMKVVEAEFPARVILPWDFGYNEYVPPTPPRDIEEPVLVEPEPLPVPAEIYETPPSGTAQ